MIYEYVPDWFTITCWTVGGLLLLAVIIAHFTESKGGKG